MSVDTLVHAELWHKETLNLHQICSVGQLVNCMSAGLEAHECSVQGP